MNVKPEEDLLGCDIADVVVGAGSCIIKRVLSRPRSSLIGALIARRIKKGGKGGGQCKSHRGK